MPADIDDINILNAFKNPTSKSTAFTQLVKKYQQRLYWHIRRLVVSHNDADDILQNTFIKIWKHLDNFREESNLYTWMYKIATNEALSWLEQLKRQQQYLTVGETIYLENKLSQENGYNSNKIEWKLQKALLTLPEKQRIVFNLRYYDEMPYEEMSVILETSVGALKASYHHAVKKVETFLLAD